MKVESNKKDKIKIKAENYSGKKNSFVIIQYKDLYLFLEDK